MEKVINYIEKNQDRFIEELKDYLRIPSISTLKENQPQIKESAEFIANQLKTIGMKKVKAYKTAGNPIVYGEWMGAKGKPTVLIYGHYDVQPVDPLELWKSDPFEPEIRDGKIYARGANDNKGQHFAHVKAVESLFKVNGKPPVNIKFVIEGEEEIGSENLEIFLNEKKDLLKCDAVMVSDTSMHAPKTPTISYGLRGLCYMEVQITGPNRDLHSGSFGGSVANPINELSKLITKLVDENGKVTIPNFYKDVIELSDAEREQYKTIKFSEKAYAKDLGVKELQGEGGYSTLERLSGRPTLDCNGIYGGFTGEGAKTVLPSTATAKISMRLVPNQIPKKIAKEFEKHVKSLVPKSVKVEVRALHGGLPFLVPFDDEVMQAAAEATTKATGKKAIFTREGGSIPIVVEFNKILKAPVVLMGLGLDSDDIHSPNEHFWLENFEYGLKASVYFMEEMSNR
ncbi:MAG: dipeptidase [Melioribacteraceae bacterium]|nr:dipeptidase [Melioribacteraceae bacterium]MCF8266303.1 dipeptidase [Melioribacteraceae bacterium]MCF8411961.1 dipeptidase [Melioribacteraceae bacterium]